MMLVGETIGERGGGFALSIKGGDKCWELMTRRRGWK